MESPENDRTVFRPSHKPWKSTKPISTFPPPRLLREIYVKIPKRSRLKLPVSNRPFRLIPGLEKTAWKCSSSRLSSLGMSIGRRQPSISSRSRVRPFSELRRCCSLRFSQARDVDDDEGNIVLLRRRGRVPAPHL